MDSTRFDHLARAVGSLASRRGAVRVLAAGALAGVLGRGTVEDAAARCPRARKCGGTCCRRDTFCCDDKRGTCCGDGADCCNPGPGTGSCCATPSRCAKPLFTNDADYVCCPRKRQWTTSTGGVRCCPAGTRALEGVDSDNGPCCPEARWCGGVCCGFLAPVCINARTQQCCTQELACGADCCKPDSGTGTDGEVCTRDGCCPQIKAASNCRKDEPNCGERICCDAVWTQEGRGLACPAAGDDPNTRAYCCGPGKSCCFTGCCPDGSRCCGDGQNCCPDGVSCGSSSCFAPSPDHV